MSDEQSPASPDAPRRRSPWRVPALIAGIVAAIAVAAVLGGIAGRSSAPGPTIVVAPGPVLEESPVVSALPVGGGSSPSPAVTTAGRPDLQAGAQSAAPWPAIFVAAPDLPDVPGVASGYRLTRAGLDGSSLAGSLATSLGLTGDVSTTESGWVVGVLDGSAPTLTVNDDPLLTWSFADPGAEAASANSAAIPKDRAKDLAAALLSSIGVDVASVDWQVDRYSNLTSVVAWQVVAGARTQLGWQLGFGKDGALVSASGLSAGIEQVPGYPVIGAATAVGRAALPTWSVIGPTPIYPAPADVPTAEPSAVATSTPRPTASRVSRPPLRVPMSEILVTQAELGLGQFWQPDGDLLILPAYQLTGDDGTRWSLIAITGDDVHFIDQPYPSANPLAQ